MLRRGEEEYGLKGLPRMATRAGAWSARRREWGSHGLHQQRRNRTYILQFPVCLSRTPTSTRFSPPPSPPRTHTHTYIPPHWQLTQHTTGLGLSGKLAAIVFVSKIFLFSYPATQSPAALPHHRLTPGWGALLHLGEEGRLGPDEAVRQDQADPGYGLLGREALRGHSCAMRDGMHIFYVRV